MGKNRKEVRRGYWEDQLDPNCIRFAYSRIRPFFRYVA